MESTILTKVVLPLALFIVMLGMGLSLKLEDFKRVGVTPRPVFIGLMGQLVFLPLVAFMIATVLGLSHLLSVGLLAIALCPGGVTSNLFSYLAKGNVALSITLTAIVSLVTPFTIPIFLGIGMTHFLGEATAISLPLQKTIITLIAITVLPVGLGMIIYKKAPYFAQKCEKPVKILSIVFLLIVIGGIVGQVSDKLAGFFAQAGLACFLLCATTMALGFWGAKVLGSHRKDCITTGIEVGIQNGTTGLFITSNLLGDAVMAVPSAVYTLIMFAMGGAYAYYFSKKS